MLDIIFVQNSEDILVWDDFPLLGGDGGGRGLLLLHEKVIVGFPFVCLLHLSHGKGLQVQLLVLPGGLVQGVDDAAVGTVGDGNGVVAVGGAILESGHARSDGLTELKILLPVVFAVGDGMGVEFE